MLSGAVLAGGKSLRYGKNKALEVFRGKRLIDSGVETLRTLCDPVFVVANDLRDYFGVRATLVQDILPHQGPLGGIYTALLFSPHDWVFAKATDIPLLVPELIGLLFERRHGFDAVVPLYNERFEPLLALYHRRCYPVIAEFLEGEERKVTSFYRRIKVQTLAEEKWRSVDPEAVSFKNVNTPGDWENM